MQILKIMLHDIKSFHKGSPGIEFQKGVNFISGRNGSGKSTIVESIGLSLFNHNPYPLELKSIVRHGKGFGVIKVWIELEDERVYRIERRIGNNPSWVVYDEEDGLDIAVGDESVTEWLAKAFSIEHRRYLPDIFSNILGVSQGEFTTWFKLRPGREKSNHFDPIINVEVYKQSSDYLSPIKNQLIPDRIHELSNLISEIDAYLKDHKDDQDQLKKKERAIKKEEKRLRDLKDTLSTLIEERSNLDRIRTDYEKGKKDKGIIEAEIKGLEERKENEEGQLKRALVAKKILDDNLEGYNTFKESESLLKKLEKDRKRKERLEHERTNLGRQEERLSSIIKANLGNLMEKETKMKEMQEFLQEESRVLDKEDSLIKQEERDAKDTSLAIKELEKKVRGMELQIEHLKNVESNLEASILDMEKKERDIKEILNSIVDEERYLQEASRLISIEGEKTALQEKITILKTQIKAKREEKKRAKGGLCPILKERCERIDPEVFNKEIERRCVELQGYEESFKKAEAKYKETKRAKEVLTEYDKRKTMVESLKKEIEERFKTCLTTVQEIDYPSLIKGIDELSIHFLRERFLRDKPVFKNLTKLEELKDELSAFKEDAKCKITEYRRLVDQALLKTVEKEGQITGKRKAFEERRKNLNRELKELEKEKEQAIELKKQIEGLKTDLKENRERQKILVEQLKAYKGLSEEIDKCNKKRQDSQEAYRLYISNEKEGKNLREYQKKLSETISCLSEKKKVFLKLKQEVERLEVEYDSERYKELEQDIREKEKEIGQVTEGVKRSKEEIDKLRNVVQGIKERKEKKKSLEREKERFEFTKEVTSEIWTVLRQVAPFISKRLLENISIRANEIYNWMSREPSQLEWAEGYEVKVKTKAGVRTFRQLSGGEQMSAALSIQLAMVKDFTKISFCIFDEPTTNLDDVRCDRLGQAIHNVRNEYGFDQLFVISHDGTFASSVENEIRLVKDPVRGSRQVE
ncbi:MAG: SMC family ATPase [bacterium]|nr:SMC family ATPase [bacterium]